MKYRTRIQYTRDREGADVGSLARGRVAACDRSALRPSPSLDRRHSVEDRRDTAAAATSLARALALAEREEISRGVMAGQSVRSIARSLATRTLHGEPRDPSQRWPASYRASEADQAAWDRAQRPKRCKLAQNRALARIVAEKLQLEWSP